MNLPIVKIETLEGIGQINWDISLDKMDKDNPIIAQFLKQWMERDGPEAIMSGVMVYYLLNKQIECDELNDSSDN